MKKIVNFTPTGTNTTRENSLAPLEPNEIVEEVCQVFEKKLITLVHIHARDKDLNNTYKAEHYRPIIEGIRRHCPDLAICTSLTGRHFNEFEKRSEVLELKPDMGSLTMGSWNYSNGVNINTPEMIVKLAERMNKLNIVPEIECFDAGMLNYANYLISKGILKKPYYINMIFGNLFNAQFDVDVIDYLVKLKPHTSKMCFGGIGKTQNSVINYNVRNDGWRVGLEDNFYDSKGNKVKNIELLDTLHKSCNFELVTPKEFKQWLQY
jgi:uncharacterized protein (DUF849 family)